MKPSTRRLISSLVYAGSAAFSMMSLVKTGAELDRVDLGLNLVGLLLWGLGATQSLLLDYGDYRADAREEIDDVPPPCLRRSSHSLVNASLYMVSSSAYLVSDLRQMVLRRGTPPARVLSSLFWFKNALLNMVLSLTVERQESSPDATQLCHVHATACYLLTETDCLLSGIMDAIAMSQERDATGGDIASNVCWMAASMHDLAEAGWFFYRDRGRPDAGAYRAVREEGGDDSRVDLPLPSPVGR